MATFVQLYLKSGSTRIVALTAAGGTLLRLPAQDEDYVIVKCVYNDNIVVFSELTNIEKIVCASEFYDAGLIQNSEYFSPGIQREFDYTLRVSYTPSTTAIGADVSALAQQATLALIKTRLDKVYNNDSGQYGPIVGTGNKIVKLFGGAANTTYFIKRIVANIINWSTFSTAGYFEVKLERQDGTKVFFRQVSYHGNEISIEFGDRGIQLPNVNCQLVMACTPESNNLIADWNIYYETVVV